MKKLVIFSATALAAAVLAATPTMTSQAAVCTYQIPGGDFCSLGAQDDCVIFDGTASVEGGFLKPIKPLAGEILQGVNWGQPDGGTQKPDDGDAAIEQVLDLVNAERAKAGVPALTLDARATEAAGTRAQEIQSSFSHTRPNGSSFSTALTEAGVRYTASGENIAYGQNSAQAVMDGWMNSSGHRANILNQSFTSIGIGHVRGAGGVDYWTQLFFR